MAQSLADVRGHAWAKTDEHTHACLAACVHAGGEGSSGADYLESLKRRVQCCDLVV